MRACGSTRTCSKQKLLNCYTHQSVSRFRLHTVPKALQHKFTAPIGHKVSVASHQTQQRGWRLGATVLDTVLLEDPVVEFVGVLNDGMQTVKGIMHVAADPELVYSILTDYDSCDRVFQNIVSTKTIHNESGKQVVQTCKWQFLAFKGTFDVYLNVLEEPAERMLVFRLQASSFMRDFEGRWQVLPKPGGGCIVEHVLAVKPVVTIPTAIAPYTSSMFKQQVAGLLQDLESEIRNQSATVPAMS